MISEYFQSVGAQNRLLRAAYTGIAASLIDGKTTHTIGMMNQNQRADPGEVGIEKLAQFW